MTAAGQEVPDFHIFLGGGDLRFAQGRGNYIDDVRFPNMLYLRLLRSPHAHVGGAANRGSRRRHNGR
ncbi:MAG: Aldehyde oxidase and xanthine dehydrogenase, a/b hammerhead domain [Chloroflexi bacterium]|nr:Aldehyde oxidase and xanthine dehydrogenase, a/b hammerhead domain [Chloroflexota bacterium]